MSEAARKLARRLQQYEDPLNMPSDVINAARKELAREEYFDCARLRSLRKQRKLSQKAVAEAVHMSTTSYGMAERGERPPYRRQTYNLAKYFGVDSDFFVSVRYPDSWWKKRGRPRIGKTVKRQEQEAASSQQELSQRHVQHLQSKAKHFPKPPMTAGDKLGMKRVTVILVYLQGNSKLVTTPKDEYGLRQVLYTREGVPCQSLEDVSEKHTMTQKEIFGQKSVPRFNPAFITAEVPAIVRVPMNQRWSSEINF